MKIAVDAMGGDNAPEEIVKGCMLAARELKDVKIYLIGKEDSIRKELKKKDSDSSNLPIEIINASEVIDNSESPVKAVKTKKDSSMIKGLELLKKEEVDAFISAGSTGAFMAGALLKVGRIKGIDRPALASVIPTVRGGTLLLDMGANTDVKPKNLIQFAVMGSIYASRVIGIKEPKVALLNIGKEKEKGSQLTKEAYKILSEEPYINFIGNMEARELFEEGADVLVCDGFSGNVFLKAIEGMAFTIFNLIKKEAESSFSSKIGALLLKSKFKSVISKLDYTEYGGAPFLGIKGVCIKCHGSSNAKAVKNAIRQGKIYVEQNIIGSLFEEFSKEGER